MLPQKNPWLSQRRTLEPQTALKKQRKENQVRRLSGEMTMLFTGLRSKHTETISIEQTLKDEADLH